MFVLKTFLSSVIIFIILCSAVFPVSENIASELDSLYAEARSLPSTREELAENKEDTMRKTAAICGKWKKDMGYFPYFIGYDLLDRADEAAFTLLSCAESGEVNEFFSARLKFLDALARLRGLYSLSVSSIA